tara:strand:- start:4352 stop:5005 length:654 start_codon:yes stop_codon:yes gene_type:complete
MIMSNFKKRVFTSCFLFLLLFLISFSNSIFLYSLIIIGIFAIIEFNSLIKNINKNLLKNFFINILFILFIFVYCSLFYILSYEIYFKIILFSLLLSCVASDIGGYIFGNYFKGPKISKISPNKTISGSVGSLFLGTIVFVILLFLLMNIYNILFILTGIITSVFCQLGDLFFSYIKRKAKKKDTGNLLPGHGGVLDRIDGILLGVPSGFIFLTLVLK